jgi:hypothetical protein
MKIKRKSTWLKNRGYLHLTQQINVGTRRGEILGKVKSFEFVKKHAFFPLIHTNIKVRRYKIADGATKRAHSFEGKSNSKLRPLHYSTHIDSMIFGYYGERLQSAYLKELEKVPHLAKCVTAYRRIKNPNKQNSYKSTIHFAHEVFEEIKHRSAEGCWVLKFDIEKFFSSMDHKVLKRAWCDLIRESTLPADHYNVFKAATKFSYILRDDLRLSHAREGRRYGFDERQLSEIRKSNVSAYFENPKSLRNFIDDGNIKIYKNQFRNDNDEVIGIPQGLPISATLANLYLLNFDQAVIEEIVKAHGGYYRRYSDDIIIICNSLNKDYIIDFVDKTLRVDSKVKINKEKTEQYFYCESELRGQSVKMVHLLTKEGLLRNHPLTYLGFEYYGYKTLIKAANLSKFYRRMINAVKCRSKRAVLASIKNPSVSDALFRRRLYRLYTNINLDGKTVKSKFKKLVPNRFGYAIYTSENMEDDIRSNYFTYANKAAEIMNESRILRQVRRHRTVFNSAVKKHMVLYRKSFKT